MALLNEFRRIFGQAPQRATNPIPMILFCPNCGLQHIDAPGDPESFTDEPGRRWANPMRSGWTNPPHRSHLCEACDHVWRPADVATEGVAEIRTRGMIDDDPPIRGVANPDDIG